MAVRLRASLRILGSALRSPSPATLLALAIALALPLVFVFYTHLIWEDFFITFRYSENLAHGRGLVYSPGEHVHGFTSVLNTLLPAFFSLFSGPGHYLLPLWGFRIISWIGLAVALVSILSAFALEGGQSRLRRIAALLFIVCATLEIKTSAFAMDGQEAGLMLGFLAPALALAVVGPEEHADLIGILWAGLMYSRPDAFITIGALAIATLAFASGARAPLFRAQIRSAVICAVLYLPWFLFTWIYYGSPVPHTLSAKLGITVFAAPGFGLLSVIPALIYNLPSSLCHALAPIYDRLETGSGQWPAWTHDAQLAFELIAAFYWAVPSRDRLGRMASFAAFVLMLYLDYVCLVSQYSPWYYPPLAFLSLLAGLCALATWAEGLRPPAAAWGFFGLAGAGVLFLLGFTFFASLPPLRFKQDVVEANRRDIGLWLKDRVHSSESIYLEPLGYIGYFSGAHMADWPGLVSPQVVEARSKLGPMTADNWVRVAEALKPGWIVARPQEVEGMRKNSYLSAHYRLEKVFDVNRQLVALGSAVSAPGMNMNYSDSVFGVYHRKD